jgi:hypothetical protein
MKRTVGVDGLDTADLTSRPHRQDGLGCFLQDSERQRVVASASGRDLAMQADHHRLKLSMEAPAVLHAIEQKARKRLMVRSFMWVT